MSVKLAVIYYSASGTNYKLAQWASEGAKAEGAEVRLLQVQETAPQEVIDATDYWKAHQTATKHIPFATLDDLDWADAIIFSSPTRFGGLAAQMRQFLDTAGSLWMQGKLANKVVSAMSSAGNSHGGGEATLLQIYGSMYHWGAIVAAPGYTDQIIFAAGGCPYGTCATINQDGTFSEDVAALEKATKHQAKRTIEIASKIKA